MKILVTGLEGFTGTYVERELVNRGHSVVGLRSDLRDGEAVAQEISEIMPDGVIHLAAVSSVDFENVNVIYDVNILGTRNILVALSALPQKPSSVILASSANVYGNIKGGQYSEAQYPEPCNDYAVSKYAMEKMAATWRAELPILITRPFNYTGVGQSSSFVIPKIVNSFKRRDETISLGATNVFREFGDVRNVARIYADLLESKTSNKTVNICTGRPYSINEVISICEEITGHKIKVEVNPDFIRKNEVERLCGDDALLKELVNIDACVTFENTLKWMLDS